MRKVCLLMTLVSLSLEAMANESVRASLIEESLGISAVESWLATPAEERKLDVSAMRVPLSESEAETVLMVLGKERRGRLEVERKGEVEAASLSMGGKTLRWIQKEFGEVPAGGRSLWISLAGARLRRR